MPLTSKELLSLEEKAYELRLLSINAALRLGNENTGEVLSSIDIFTILYHKYLNIDFKNSKDEYTDRLVLSKEQVGIHLVPILLGNVFIHKQLLKEYNHIKNDLGISLDIRKASEEEVSICSLGYGLSIGLGMALGARAKSKEYKVYCLLSDEECNGESIWEAAMAIAHLKTTNLITIINKNRYIIDDFTKDIITLESFADKWRNFGFIVEEVDGHSFKELSEALDFALSENKKPVVIIANTINGCGVDFIEDDYKCIYRIFDKEKVKNAKESLEKYYETRIKEV
ncbi:1-deoxy-D-xylulose-5-phosphate synthase N-terminal domain-containing protein [Clostridium sp. Marseille-QA1073]